MQQPDSFTTIIKKNFMTQTELLPHLFRTEFRKIVAVLSRLFGIEHIEAAEDIASETFVQALETWPYHGLPENPTAWLYTVAKNKAKNYMQRNQLFDEKIVQNLTLESEKAEQFEVDLSPQNISDSQLQMLFAICHPSIATEAQIGLALRILCGFGIDEIATAFLSNKETINKRLFRAKEKLRTEKVQIQAPSETEIETRLETVLTTLYLLFSEGYYSENREEILREDLCTEALRLVEFLLEYPKTNLPKVNALYSLMCFHASRFAARRTENGEIILYQNQDESLWNYDLIAKGAFHLKQASQGQTFSKYHLEASIAYWHTIKEDSQEKWENILQLYNKLLILEYSPIAALNRTYALAKANGKQQAIVEAEKLQLTNNHYYFTLLGELYKEIDNLKAKSYFETALKLAKTESDKKLIKKQIEQLF